MQKRQQKTVRAGQLERTLEDFNAEQGQKVGTLLAEYHARFIEPRLRALETPWYVRLWRRVRG